MPGRPELPATLQRFGRALEDCCRSRLVQKTVGEVKRNLDSLRDGWEQLGAISSDLSDDTIGIINLAARTRDHELSQLRQMEALGGLEDDGSLITTHLEAERPWKDAGQLVPRIERIRERYVEVRRNLLNKQGTEAEAARSRVKTRPGFALLDPDQTHRVLRPITEAQVDTTAEAVSPTLVEVRDRFASRIRQAEETSNDLLDEELAKRPDDRPVVKVESRLRGREVESREQLKAVFAELDERIGPLLDQGNRVRIV
jgi:hypothetical protein